MTLKEKEIAERINGKFKIKLPNGKIFIFNHFTLKAAKKRAKEIADKRKSDVILIDITDRSYYVDTIRPNLRLAKGGGYG